MRSRNSPAAQRGAALLTAMIIVTLVATLAAAMVWQQWRAVQVEAAERARVQSAWILSGALDFAKLILKETVKPSEPTTLNGEWATPLAESRLSTFLAVDKSNADDGPEAFLSGYITDAQARYNLFNLVKDGKVDASERASLERLCLSVGIDSGIAARVADGWRDAALNANAAAPLKPVSVSQLTWLGLDDASAQALRPYIVLLDAATGINVNTASKEVLAAVTGMDLATAESVVQSRQRKAINDVPAFLKQYNLPADVGPRLVTNSTYFEINGRLRLVDRVLMERSLMQRLPNGQARVLERERVSSLEQVGN